MQAKDKSEDNIEMDLREEDCSDVHWTVFFVELRIIDDIWL